MCAIPNLASRKIWTPLLGLSVDAVPPGIEPKVVVL